MGALGGENTALGRNALGGLAAGSGNIAVGSQAGILTRLSNNIAIGHSGAAADNGVIRIGKALHTQTFIAGIHANTLIGGLPVHVTADGQLGTLMSSRRFKDQIRPISDTPDQFMALKPVTFQYTEAAANGSHPLQYGLIAEDVAAAYPDLVAYGEDGRPLTVYYQFLAPILLNRVQTQQRTIDAQEKRLSAQADQMAFLAARLRALEERTAGTSRR